MDWNLLENKKNWVVKIPVGNMSVEETEKLIRELMKSYDYNRFLMKERKNKLDKILLKIKNE